MSHEYTSYIVSSGSRGEGTTGYRVFDRTLDISIPGKAAVHCSDDLMLSGDPTKNEPEDLLISALSACLIL